MLSKFLFLVFLPLMLQCFEESEIIREQQETDMWIRETLRDNRNTRSCAKIEYYPKRERTFYPRRFPSWFVVILMTERLGNATLYRQECAGTLIGLQVVLTSASCVHKQAVSKMVIRAGDWVKTPGEDRSNVQQRNVESVIAHSQFVPDKLAHDIAIVILTEPFDRSIYINTICIATGQIESNLKNVKCDLSGWDQTAFGDVGYKRYKNITAVVTTRDLCEKVVSETAVGTNFSLRTDFICAHTEYKGKMLFYNSGAPLVCDVCRPNQAVIQVGILSFGYNNTALPFALTAVYQYEMWIKQICKGLLDLSTC